MGDEVVVELSMPLYATPIRIYSRCVFNLYPARSNPRSYSSRRPPSCGVVYTPSSRLNEWAVFST